MFRTARLVCKKGVQSLQTRFTFGFFLIWILSMSVSVLDLNKMMSNLSKNECGEDGAKGVGLALAID